MHCKCKNVRYSHTVQSSLFPLIRLVVRGFRKALETSDLWLLRKEETTDYNRHQFANKWEEALKQWRSEQSSKRSEKTRDSSLTESENNMTGASTNNPQMNARSSSSNTSFDANGNSEAMSKPVQKTNEQSVRSRNSKSNSRPPLVKIIIKVYGLYILFAQVLMVLYVFMYYLNPCLFWCA